MDFTERLIQKNLREQFKVNARLVGKGIPVYGDDGFEDEADLMRSTRLVCWRHITNLDDGRVLWVDTEPDKRTIVSMSFSPERDERFRKALALARKAGFGDADIRILDMPGVKEQAIWIAHEGRHTFIPFGPFSPVRIQADFIESINEKAREMRAMYARVRRDNPDELSPPGG